MNRAKRKYMKLLKDYFPYGRACRKKFLDQAQATVLSEAFQPRKAAVLALKKYGMQNKENAKKVNRLIMELKRSEREDMALVYDEIRFDIEYLL